LINKMTVLDFNGFLSLVPASELSLPTLSGRSSRN